MMLEGESYSPVCCARVTHSFQGRTGFIRHGCDKLRWCLVLDLCDTDGQYDARRIDWRQPWQVPLPDRDTLSISLT